MLLSRTDKHDKPCTTTDCLHSYLDSTSRVHLRSCTTTQIEAVMQHRDAKVSPRFTSLVAFWTWCSHWRRLLEISSSLAQFGAHQLYINQPIFYSWDSRFLTWQAVWLSSLCSLWFWFTKYSKEIIHSFVRSSDPFKPSSSPLQFWRSPRLVWTDVLPSYCISGTLLSSP